MSDTILKVAGLKVAYGGIKAVKGIDLEVNKGELVTLIGANGAGKTTTLKAITGTLPPCSVEGVVSYMGQPLKGVHSYQMVERKLAMVPEGRGVFTRMTIQENLLMGAYTRNDKAGIEADIEKWFSVFPRLKERAAAMAGTLSGGESSPVTPLPLTGRGAHQNRRWHRQGGRGRLRPYRMLRGPSAIRCRRSTAPSAHPLTPYKRPCYDC